MVGHELAVEQGEACKKHAGGEPGQSDLRSIGFSRHHAFAEKGLAQSNAIESARQLIAIPNLDRMRKADFVQMPVCLLDLLVDPGRWPIFRRLRA